MSGDVPTTVDVMKENAVRVMEKIDSQIPLYVKMSSDMYREHNSLLEHFFKAAYSLERTELEMFFSAWKSGTAEPWIRSYTNAVMAQAELAGGFLKWYPQMYVLTLKFLDKSLQDYVRAICSPFLDDGTANPDDSRKHD